MYNRALLELLSIFKNDFGNQIGSEVFRTAYTNELAATNRLQKKDDTRSANLLNAREGKKQLIMDGYVTSDFTSFRFEGIENVLEFKTSFLKSFTELCVLIISSNEEEEELVINLYRKKE